MKKANSFETPRTTLLVSQEHFKSKLAELISTGHKIYSLDLTTERQFSNAEKEYNKWHDYNNEYLKIAFNIPENEYKLRYSSSGSAVGVKEVLSGANTNQPSFQRWRLRKRLESKLENLESLLLRAELIPTEVKDDSLINNGNATALKTKSIVFIIHGHDEEMKRNVQVFLSRADLQDIVLHEQPDKNRTIIEKLIEEGAAADYVIGLLSPDDIQADGSLRARQNVLLEIGYFIGRLGRDKVRLLRRENTTIPSDLQGILYDNYDKEGAWRIKLAKEMQYVGITINIDKIISKF